MKRGEPGTDSAISAVLLAAGESRRMSEDNKLLLEVDGEPMVGRTARQLLSAQLSELERQLRVRRRADETSLRLKTIPGIGQPWQPAYPILPSSSPVL